MSDDSDFDKEAERERLREKYERDQKKREQSERMSELLLQGATMTNRHCGDCGDPIFRHEGKEFCPTCQKQVGRVDADAEGAESESADVEVESAAEQPTEPETPTQAGGQSGQPRKANGHATPQGGQGSSQPQQSGQPQQPPQQPSQQSSQQPSQQTGDRTPAPAAGAGASGGLADAEAALARTIEKYARGAEESDDVGRARDYLAAAREAAEALEAVRRAE